MRILRVLNSKDCKNKSWLSVAALIIVIVVVVPITLGGTPSKKLGKRGVVRFPKLLPYL